MGFKNLKSTRPYCRYNRLAVHCVLIADTGKELNTTK